MAECVPQVPMGINLRRLFPAASFVGCADIRVTYATDRSDDCRPGALYAAIRGHKFDGHHFVADAIQHGAAALLVEYPQSNASVPQCIIRNSRAAYAEVCSAIAGHPSCRLKMAGITGTNGKTTTTWLVRSIMRAAECQTGLLGTIQYSNGIEAEPSSLTTPESKTLTDWLASMVAHGTTHAAIELSSHALDQGRAAGTQLDVAVITNITHDHFDYHHNYESYRQSKLRIFEHLKNSAKAVVNADDSGSMSCLGHTAHEVLTYGIENQADISATILQQSVDGTDFLLHLGGESVKTHTSLLGLHNVSNCLAAAAAALHLGASPQEIALGIEALSVVPGRMERVDCNQPFHVFVDYAHTHDALRRSIAALKSLTRGRVVCLFGAGGDRDRSKRPLLGLAGSQADIAVVSSDNPCTEDPQAIIQDVLSELTADNHQPHIEVERERAIIWAIEQAQPGDSILVAGKGHETEQIIGTQRRHFDDREVIRDALSSMAGLCCNQPTKQLTS